MADKISNKSLADLISDGVQTGDAVADSVPAQDVPALDQRDVPDMSYKPDLRDIPDLAYQHGTASTEDDARVEQFQRAQAMAENEQKAQEAIKNIPLVDMMVAPRVSKLQALARAGLTPAPSVGRQLGASALDALYLIPSFLKNIPNQAGVTLGHVLSGTPLTKENTQAQLRGENAPGVGKAVNVAEGILSNVGPGMAGGLIKGAGKGAAALGEKLLADKAAGELAKQTTKEALLPSLIKAGQKSAVKSIPWAATPAVNQYQEQGKVDVKEAGLGAGGILLLGAASPALLKGAGGLGLGVAKAAKGVGGTIMYGGKPINDFMRNLAYRSIFNRIGAPNMAFKDPSLPGADIEKSMPETLLKNNIISGNDALKDEEGNVISKPVTGGHHFQRDVINNISAHMDQVARPQLLNALKKVDKENAETLRSFATDVTGDKQWNAIKELAYSGKNIYENSRPAQGGEGAELQVPSTVNAESFKASTPYRTSLNRIALWIKNITQENRAIYKTDGLGKFVDEEGNVVPESKKVIDPIKLFKFTLKPEQSTDPVENWSDELKDALVVKHDALERPPSNTLFSPRARQIFNDRINNEFETNLKFGLEGSERDDLNKILDEKANENETGPLSYDEARDKYIRSLIKDKTINPAEVKDMSVDERINKMMHDDKYRMNLQQLQQLKEVVSKMTHFKHGVNDADAAAMAKVYNSFYMQLKNTIEDGVAPKDEAGNPIPLKDAKGNIQRPLSDVEDANQTMSNLMASKNALLRSMPRAERKNMPDLRDIANLGMTVMAGAHTGGLGAIVKAAPWANWALKQPRVANLMYEMSKGAPLPGMQQLGKKMAGTAQTVAEHAPYVAPYLKSKLGDLFKKNSLNEEGAIGTEKAIGNLQQTKSDNFKNWFGDYEKEPEKASKIVDKRGKPLVVYHGTASDFSTFNAGAPTNFGNIKNKINFFTREPAQASSYAKAAANANLTREIMPQKIIQSITDNNRKIQKKLISGGDLSDDMSKMNDLYNSSEYKKYSKKIMNTMNSKNYVPEGANVKPVYLNIRNPYHSNLQIESEEGFNTEIRYAKKHGYDGIIFDKLGTEEDAIPGVNQQYIVPFSNNQIKSAIGNSGRFSRAVNDIRGNTALKMTAGTSAAGLAGLTALAAMKKKNEK
jgi:ADP-Ribosyltransferase in polyvalent proteins